MLIFLTCPKTGFILGKQCCQNLPLLVYAGVKQEGPDGLFGGFPGGGGEKPADAPGKQGNGDAP